MEMEKDATSSLFMSENYKNNVKHFAYYLLVALYFALLMYCLHLFSWSDQYLYRLYYDGLEMRSFKEGYELYASIVGAREPIYFILTYVLHYGITKDILDILLSSSFFVVLLFYFHRIKAPKTIVSLLITGIYFLSVFFITERLKLGVMFLLLYFLFAKYRYGLIFILLAILSHAQLLIILPFLYVFSKVKINNKKAIFLLAFISLIVFASLFQHLAHKLPIYFARYSFFNILKPLFFGMITFSFVNEKYRKEYFSFFIPVIVVALFFGDGRMTSFAFLGSVYFWSIEKKMNLGFLLLFLSSCYFSLRGLVLLLSATIYGDGYTAGISDILKMLIK